MKILKIKELKEFTCKKVYFMRKNGVVQYVQMVDIDHGQPLVLILLQAIPVDRELPKTPSKNPHIIFPNHTRVAPD